jgi:hypothetical protein
MTFSDAHYDETDALVSRTSPYMTPIHPKLELSPSPTLELPVPKVSAVLGSGSLACVTNCCKVRATPGDAVLVSYLGNGRNQDVVLAASNEVDDEDDEDNEDFDDVDNDGYSTANDSITCGSHLKEELGGAYAPRSNPRHDMASPELQHLATESLKAVATDPEPADTIPRLTADISASTRQLSIRDDPPPKVLYPCPDTTSSPNTNSASDSYLRRPTIPTPGGMNNGALPPLQMDSPKSDFSVRSLPSITSQLGDLKKLSTERALYSEGDMCSPRSLVSAYPGSPPGGMPRLPPITATHASPPLSPHDSYSRTLGSPNSTSTPSSQYQFASSGSWSHRGPNPDYSSSGTGETPGTDHSGSTPATSATSVADLMSLDNISNPMGPGYQCTEPGCTAPPFQTQYLLNSHANVHSSARPHYCPVPGCPRGEAGKGFKRKNEMIRHGLVHDSPGYVCPFCPEREHKYPRPDNLQRHVRVHHVDKDRDDPLLRQVLAQRADGPSRGRRRRGAGS